MSGLKSLLEDNGYDVITAQDGLQAIDFLGKQKEPPDLIVSGIIMPKMNGYDFFKMVSTNSQWNHIPFVFLTLISSPENVRWSKLIGDDVDHVLKSIKDEDILAYITHKLARNKAKNLTNQQIQKSSFIKEHGSASLGELILCFVMWDDRIGPYLKDQFPPTVDLPFPLEKINYQLFNALASIYGQDEVGEPQGVLLNIPKIKRTAYIFFDALTNRNTRSRASPYILSVLAPQINYPESEQIKTIFHQVSCKIKSGNKWDLENTWSEISNLLMPSLSDTSESK